jgi:hypothetical protein
MTRDEIIAFARDSGMIDFRDADLDEHVADFVDFLCDFAASVAAEERDACLEDVRTVGGQFSVECEALMRKRRGSHA